MKKSSKKPNCYKCKYRATVPGDTHSRCNNAKANVIGDNYGKRKGWFSHPNNFDPIWLKECDGFSILQSYMTETGEGATQ